MVRDTWHLVSGSRGAMCHVQNESNMSSKGTQKRHVATHDWKEIQGRWIRISVIKEPLGSGQVASERTSHLTSIFSQPVGREGKRGRKTKPI